MKGYIDGRSIVYGVFKKSDNELYLRDWYADFEKTTLRKIIRLVKKYHKFSREVKEWAYLIGPGYQIVLSFRKNFNFCHGCGLRMLNKHRKYCGICEGKIEKAVLKKQLKGYVPIDYSNLIEEKEDVSQIPKKKKGIRKGERKTKKEVRKECSIPGCNEWVYDCFGFCIKHHDERVIPYFKRRKVYKKALQEEEIGKVWKVNEEKEIVKVIRRGVIDLRSKKEAMDLIEEMERIEGKEFTKKVLNGIPDAKRTMEEGHSPKKKVRGERT